MPRKYLSAAASLHCATHERVLAAARRSVNLTVPEINRQWNDQNAVSRRFAASLSVPPGTSLPADFLNFLDSEQNEVTVGSTNICIFFFFWILCKGETLFVLQRCVRFFFYLF